MFLLYIMLGLFVCHLVLGSFSLLSETKSEKAIRLHIEGIDEFNKSKTERSIDAAWDRNS